MTRQIMLTPEFVDYIPEHIKDGRIYICIQYSTAVHKCCCGCGTEVVTPFSPTDWKLISSGNLVSLDPSIGNWSFPCQSHYWIKQNKVVWAKKCSRQEIQKVRAQDRLAKDLYYNGRLKTNKPQVSESLHNQQNVRDESFFGWLASLFRR